MATRDLIPPDVSRRFDVLRTLLVVFVVGIHAEKGVIAYYQDVPSWLNGYLLLFPHNVFRLAVPLFFTLSGYLLLQRYRQEWGAYVKLVRNKTRTILLPYLLFNLISLGLIFAFDKIPYIGDVNTVHQRGFFNMLLGLYGHPVNYTLWFLRDLYVYFLLTPVFYAVVDEVPGVGLVVFWAMWNFVPQEGIPVEMSGAFFFYLGCFLAKTKVDLDVLRPYFTPAALLYLASVLATALVEGYLGFVPAYYPLYRAEMVLGVAFIWGVSDRGWLKNSRWLYALSGFSFFIYLTHEPILSYGIYSTRYLFELFDLSGSAAGIVYEIVLLAMTFAAAAALARLLWRYLPKVYAVATGSR